MIAAGLYVPTNLGKRGHIWHRYVLGELSGMVRYSRGGTRHFMCRAKTFEKWIERYEAKHKPNVGPGDITYVPQDEMTEEADDEAA